MKVIFAENEWIQMGISQGAKNTWASGEKHETFSWHISICKRAPTTLLLFSSDSLIKQAITQLFKSAWHPWTTLFFFAILKIWFIFIPSSPLLILKLFLPDFGPSRNAMQTWVPNPWPPFLKCILHVEIKLEKPRKFYLFYLVTFLTCRFSTIRMHYMYFKIHFCLYHFTVKAESKVVRFFKKRLFYSCNL